MANEVMTEAEARKTYIDALQSKDFETAAWAALVYGEWVGARSAEGAQVLSTAAVALATLSHNQTQVWLWENRMPGHFGVA
jgi:hypothetical protein